jgi:AGZA family xanthine/uracil permease-like MFS transporter
MRYRWASRGDVNAFFGLMLDNLAVIVILVKVLTTAGPVTFTSDFVLTHMIPGTALGVLLGDLVYSWMAFRLARRTGRPDVTAMPLGLDTPSTFGIAFLVLLPALKDAFDNEALTGHDHGRAMEFAWHVGLTVLVLVGVFKMLLAPLGNAVRRFIPRAGLLGSLAAIALTLIAFLPLLFEIAAAPLVGLAALTVVLVTLVAHRELPGKFPGALAAVLVGVVVLQASLLLDRAFDWHLAPRPEGGGSVPGWEPGAMTSFYGGDFGWWRQVFVYAVGKLPLALPFALATIVGGIDCTESAAAAGDEYDTRAVLLTEGVASFAAGLLGGVIQTTPYIGHPAYKKMGGRVAYTLATALFIGAAGFFGWVTVLYGWLPTAAMFPILVFVGLEITAQSFHATPTRHYPALVLAALPALAYLAALVLKNLFGPAVPESPPAREWLQTLRCLSNGFLISGLLWAAALAMLLDGRLVRSAAFLAVAGVCAFFGVIHSPLADERIGLPYDVLLKIRDETPQLWEAALHQTPYHWAGAYALAALLLLGLAAFKGAPPREKEGPEEAKRPEEGPARASA